MNMNKHRAVLTLIGLGALPLRAQSSSFMQLFVPAIYFDASAADTDCVGKNITVDSALIGWTTTHPRKLGAFFGPFDKSTLTVAEQNATLSSARDIDARHLGIYTSGETFESNIQFRPRQIGICCNLKGSMKLYKELTLTVNAPIVHVRNTMRLKETVLSSGGAVQSSATGIPWVTNATDAFKQPAWQYGKINGTQTKTRIGKLDVTLSTPVYSGKHSTVTGTAGIIIPTGNKTKGTYLFEPVAGNGGFGGFIWGANAQWDLCEKESTQVFATADMSCQYWLGNTQVRSFDLKQKEWSRYMRVFENADAATAASNSGDFSHASPGINTFTQPVKMKHGFSGCSFDTAVHLVEQKLEVAVGYHFDAHTSDAVSLKQSWTTTIALASSSNPGFAAPARTINDRFSGADSSHYLTISEGDLDLSSAAQPALINHTLYASGHYHYEWSGHPLAIRIGLGYEFSTEQKATNRVIGWISKQFLF